MRPLYRNLFFAFGLIAIGVMLYTFDVKLDDMVRTVVRGGPYLPAVIGIWVFVYACNALAFRIIVNSVGEGAQSRGIGFAQSFRLTVSGFAFSYTTPFGSGGAPYRILELNTLVGKQRSLASTVLYSMMHIFSHFCLWTSAALLFPLVYGELMTPFLWGCLALYLIAVALVTYFFYRGYKWGMIVKALRIVGRIPGLRGRTNAFVERHREALEQTDRNIATLHAHPQAFYTSLLAEYVGRVINSLEFFFILLALGVDVTFWDGLFVLAFSSLVGNLLFFLPMQLGAREGGLAAVLALLGKAAAEVGIFTSIYTRLRELFWIAVGVAFVKFGPKRQSNEQPQG